MLALVFALFLGCAQAALHHLFVGTTDGSSLYTLELNDTARTVSLIRNSVAAGASPSIALHRSNLYLFGARPSDGTVSRYAVKDDFSLQLDGTMDIPASCNTKSFVRMKLFAGVQSPYGIYGSASTGNCSTLFLTSLDGYFTLKSKDLAGDIRSLALSPSGSHLYALDFKTNSILNYNITQEPTLTEILDNVLLSNVTSPRQIIAHPFGHRIYVVTQDSNELLDIPLSPVDRVGNNVTAHRFNVLPSSLKWSDYTTQSLAISSSNTTLWTLSRSMGQSVITAFRIDAQTGAVGKPVARAGWVDNSSSKESLIAPAPIPGDVIAVTNSPQGIVAFIGLDGTNLKSYGRVDLGNDPGCCGEGVWVD